MYMLYVNVKHPQNKKNNKSSTKTCKTMKVRPKYIKHYFKELFFREKKIGFRVKRMFRYEKKPTEFIMLGIRLKNI